MNDEDNRPRLALAQNLAKKLLQDSGGQKPPIKLNNIVKYLKNSRQIKIIPFDLGKKTSGIQVTQEDEIIIGYNSKQHTHRQRFTVAHELGHLMLGHTHKGSDYNPESKDVQEFEANCFASELLMPLATLKDDYLLRETDPKILASNYEVSEEAMWLRLLACDLIKY